MASLAMRARHRKFVAVAVVVPLLLAAPAPDPPCGGRGGDCARRLQKAAGIVYRKIQAMLFLLLPFDMAPSLSCLSLNGLPGSEMCSAKETQDKGSK
jgi:hypothetical protein